MCPKENILLLRPASSQIKIIIIIKKTPEGNDKEKVGKCAHTYLRSNTGLEVISNTYVSQDIFENTLLIIGLKLISQITLFMLMAICTVECSFPEGKEINSDNSPHFYFFTVSSLWLIQSGWLVSLFHLSTLTCITWTAHKTHKIVDRGNQKLRKQGFQDKICETHMQPGTVPKGTVLFLNQIIHFFYDWK